MSELADQIELIIESLEMVANYSPEGMMLNADTVLFADCIRLKVIADELRKSNDQNQSRRPNDQRGAGALC